MSVEASSIIGATKLSGYLGAIAIFEYLQIPQQQMGILALLMMIDFITGVGKQYRIDPVTITSRRAWLGVMKKSATIISIFSVALILKGINLLSTEYISTILSILIMAEGYSSIQNIYAIRTGNILPEFDAISIFLKTFSEFLKEKIDKSLPNSANIPKK